MFVVLAGVGLLAYHFAPFERRDHRVLFAMAASVAVMAVLMILWEAAYS